MENVHNKTLPEDLLTPEYVGKYRNAALLIGVLFAVISAVASLKNPDCHQYFMRGYLVGFMLWTGMSIGCLALLMVQYLTGGKWGLLVRRILEASALNLVLMLGFWLLFAGLGGIRMYPWSWSTHDPQYKALSEGAKHAIEFRQHLPAFMHNLPYMDREGHGFIARGIIYFAIWIGYMLILRRWSLKRDQEMGNNAYWRVKFENLCGLGVLVYVLTITFASIDWIMSLDPQWYSSIYGLLYLAGQGLGSLSLIIITLSLLSQADPIKTLLRKTEMHDIGKLMLAFVMLYAYFAFSQFLIIWSGNLSDEIPWYMRRLNGYWGYVAVSVLLGHFVLPFLLLLSRDLKRNFGRIVPLACFVIFMRLVDLFWLTAPNFSDSQPFPLRWAMLFYLAVPVAIGGIWVSFFLGNLKLRPLVQRNDPHLEQILEHEHLPEHEHAAV